MSNFSLVDEGYEAGLDGPPWRSVKTLRDHFPQAWDSARLRPGGEFRRRAAAIPNTEDPVCPRLPESP
jgi:hypothetical protein